MSVKQTHKDYDRMLPFWQKCRTTAEGQESVHAQGEVFLPRLTNQNDAEYRAYKLRAGFYNATWRTIDGMRGMIFRKPMVVKMSDRMQEMCKDITMTGQSLHMFASDVVEEVLKVGRVGLFVDYPEVAAGTTLADANLRKHRPTLRKYRAENAINWKHTVIDGVSVMSMVVLTECVEVPIDEFSSEEKTQYRVLDLMPLMNNDGVVIVYRVRVMEVRKNAETGMEEDVTISTAYPRIQGKHLSEIPFQFLGTDDVSTDVDLPPLLDLVDVNLAHYRVSADYEHGCHFTGLPTPVISGYMKETDGESFSIGSTTAWVFSNAQAKASYLEFTGQGLAALEKNLSKKENYMTILGARMLQSQRTTTESADTAQINQGGEQSMLASIAICVSAGLTKTLNWFAKFANVNEEITVDLNRDFFPFKMDSLQITAIVAAWQNQAISYETMYENLKRGEIVDITKTYEQELEEIKKNPPPQPEAGTTPGSSAPNLKKGGVADNPTITELQGGRA